MLKLELDTVKAYSVDDEFKFRMEADQKQLYQLALRVLQAVITAWTEVVAIGMKMSGQEVGKERMMMAPEFLVSDWLAKKL